MVTLTDRQKACLELIANGMRDQDVAAQIGIDLATVRFHIRRCILKFSAANRVHAVFLATQDHLIGGPDVSHAPGISRSNTGRIRPPDKRRERRSNKVDHGTTR